MKESLGSGGEGGSSWVEGEEVKESLGGGD